MKRKFTKVPVMASSRRGWWNKYFTCMDLDKYYQSDYFGEPDDVDAEYFEKRVRSACPNCKIICALIPKDDYSDENYCYLVEESDGTVAVVDPMYDTYYPQVYYQEDFIEKYPRW